MNFQSLIETRRDGGVHSEAELRYLASAAATGEVPDYQLAAWLMAAYLNPLNADETAWLTLGMADSGERLDLSGLPKPWVDKHSTGGVGDKTTLVLLPLLAACGLTMVKMSGRGLGITGGTVDKLASIPGFRLDLSPAEMKAQAAQIGLALTGQTPNLAPADKVLYALRDATATVGSIPLIVSSILSKKIAGGAETIVLDVKAGSGAFMKTLPEAERLASALKETAVRCGLNVRVVLSDMSQPLGSAVGNALEVREALSILRGHALSASSMRFRDLCLDLARITLEASGIGVDPAEVLASGKAFDKAKVWFAAQGASTSFADDLVGLPDAAVVGEFLAPAAGVITELDAQCVGEMVVALGGGRTRKDDVLDLGVGVEILASVGEVVEPGQLVARVHARTAGELDSALTNLETAIRIIPGSTASMSTAFLRSV